MTDRPISLQIRPGSFEQALANGWQLLKDQPSAALNQAETLNRLRRDARVFRLAAAACRSLRMSDEAEAAELGGIQAALSDRRLEQASTAEAEGRYSDADSICTEYLAQNPDDLLAMTLAAESALGLWQLERAEKFLRDVLERAPSFLRASMLLIKCLQRQARVRDAIEVSQGILSRKPENLPALTSLAQLLSEVGEADRAAETSMRIVTLAEDEPDRWIHHAHYLRILGRTDDAKRALRQSLRLRPSGGAGWWGLANYYPNDLTDADTDAIAAALPGSMGSPDEATLNLALGLVASHRGDHEKAFSYISEGKRLRLKSYPFDPVRSWATIEDSQRNYNSHFFEKWQGLGSGARSPIFLIGMHRSGSTLIERILSQHSQVEGVGEMQVLARLVRSFLRAKDYEEGLDHILDSIAPGELRQLGDQYVWRSADFRKTAKPRFIDKLNFNWMHLGLIRAALPHARIIDVRRNALDCCWANFKMLFTEGHPASNDLRHIGLFYRGYVQYTRAINEAAPGGLLSVRYEDVVDDIEGQTRRMLDFLGLEFEPQCLDFHLSEGAVATASSEQVRQPLNRKGIGSAEPYRQWLGPLIEELGPLAQQPS
jgi:tetratricopeptide (TPR) repeat protein